MLIRLEHASFRLTNWPSPAAKCIESTGRCPSVPSFFLCQVTYVEIRRRHRDPDNENSEIGIGKDSVGTGRDGGFQ